MRADEVAQYYEQFLDLSEKEKSIKKSQLKSRLISKKNQTELSDWVLAIKGKDDKLIGKMEVFDIGEKKCFLSIEIPNDNWVIKYGTEAIDQFIKICSKQKLFNSIEIEARNDIVELYRKQHEMDEYVIRIA